MAIVCFYIPLVEVTGDVLGGVVCVFLCSAQAQLTLMKSPALQSMLTSDSSRLMTSLGSPIRKAAQPSCGWAAMKVNWPSVAIMSKHP